MSKKVMKLVCRHAGWMQCKVCGHERQATIIEKNGSAPTDAERNGPSAKLLANGASKKGPQVFAMSIAMPGGRCPFASLVCSRLCYAGVGKFPLNAARYEANYRATAEPDFVERACGEIEGLARRNVGGRIAVCLHEKGEFYSLEYLRQWGRIIQEVRSFPNVVFFVYTRSWISEVFRKELDLIAAQNSYVRINLSTDREMNEKYGVPHRVGDGMIVHLAETDGDLPPAGVDIILRNLRVRDHKPMERIGDTLVCPNESGLYVAKEHELPVVKDGRTVRIRCQDCRLCIDRGLGQWEQVKAGYLKKLAEDDRLLVWDPALKKCLSGQDIESICANGNGVQISLSRTALAEK